MPQEVQFGTVRYYNPRKKYGFIQSDAGEKVFFHINDRRYVSVETFWAPRFQRRIYWMAYDYRELPTDQPSLGDRLCFEVRQTDKGFRALDWVYEDAQLSAQAQLNPQFRVLRQREVVHKGCWVVQPAEEIFQGSLEELEAAFPHTLKDDPLATLDRLGIKVKCTIELETPDGWEDCEQEPRVWTRHDPVRGLVAQ